MSSAKNINLPFHHHTVHTYINQATLFELIVSLSAATFTLSLLARGLSYTEVGFCQAIYMAGAFLFQLPAVLLAERYGKRPLILLAWIFLALAMGIFYLASRFAYFALAEALYAMASASFGVALETWCLDRVTSDDSPVDGLEHIFGRKFQLKWLAGFAGGWCGALVAGPSLELPWLLGLALAVLGFALSRRWMREDRSSPPPSPRKRTALRWDDLRDKPGILLGLAVAGLLGFSTMAVNMYWAPIFRDKITRTMELSWIWLLISVFLYLGSWLVPRCCGRFAGKRSWLAWSLVLMGLGLFSAGMATGGITILFCLLTFEFGRGFIEPLRRTFINGQIAGEKRASLLALEECVYRFSAAAGLLSAGAIAQHYDLRATWLLSAGVLVVAGVAIAAWSRLALPAGTPSRA